MNEIRHFGWVFHNDLFSGFKCRNSLNLIKFRTLIIKVAKFVSVYSKKDDMGTFEFLIDAHVRLFIFEKKSHLCLLIRDCAFISFGSTKK